MDQNNTLDITEFFSVCSQIVLQSGKIIHEFFDPKGVLSKTKNGDEPFTEADVKVQTLIIKGLRTIWPNIKIIGEEEEVFSESLDFNFDELKKDLVPKDLFKDISSYTIDLNKAIVWVDPLDGTVEFIRGALDCVTTLIGISVEGRAKVGVVGKYFTETGEKKYDWEPKCYFADADYPKLYYVDYANGSKIENLEAKVAGGDGKLIVCTSRNHFTEELQEKINKINADVVNKVGGAGNKVISVIRGEADCSFYPKAGMKNWDICAGEAILRSIGGVVTDKNNNKLEYSEEKSRWFCDKGVICSISQEKHDRVMKNL